MSEVDFTQELLDELASLSTVTETFTLPTKGRLDGIGEKVSLRMMTTHEEKIRTGSKGSFWKTISSIINKCIVEPKGIDAYKLTVVDFIFLMYKLRIVSYGKDYKVNLSSCPECEQKLSDVVVDLDKLKVSYIDDVDNAYGGSFQEPFEIKLPKTGWTIGCRLLRMYEYDEIVEESNKILDEFPNYEGNPITALRLARQIVTIKGKKLPPHVITKLVDKLPAEDENKITQTFDKINMGLNLNAEYICPKCGKKIIIPLAYTEEFFRPTSD